MISVHLLFDLLAYSTGILMGLVFRKHLLHDIKNPIPKALRKEYLFIVVQGVIIGALSIGTIELMQMNVPEIGKSILGAIVGGTIAAELFKKINGIHGSTGLWFVPSVSWGIFVGRWGCFFTGLPDQTYGIPTSSMFGVDFGDGMLRHPVQLYEGFSMLFFFLLFTVMMFRKNSFWRRNGFYLFVGFYGLQRFIWEFLKPYPPLLGSLNFFQLLCLGLLAYAWYMLRMHERHLQA